MASARQIAGYRVLAKIGEGAASELYAVQDPKTKQVWALKQVHVKTPKDQRFVEQVEGEYEVGSKLEHANIRGVQKIIRQRKRFKVQSVSLVMELVDGTTLDRRLPRNYNEAATIFAQVARGLAHMHGRGFVHADLKPNNILVTEDEDVKIIDLGQACKIGTVNELRDSTVACVCRALRLA